jgi:hypothetical protein
MKVFISWSGEPSRELAEALHGWLPLVLHYVEPYMSDVDIDAGERWADSVAKELESSNFGIICVTRQNVSSSWILFEAGALAKSLKGSRVIPLLFDLDFQDISGPLAQFQAKKVEKNGVGEVVQSINQAAESPDDQNRATQLFDALWPQLEVAVQEIQTDGEPAKPSRPQGEVLEELVASIRTLDGRVREMGDPARPPRRRRTSKRQAMMQMELAHMSMDGPGDPVTILTLASAFKEAVPWISDLGKETYRAVIEESHQASYMVDRFLRTVDAALHGPFARDLEFDPGFVDMLLHEASGITRRRSPTPPPPDDDEDNDEESDESEG